MNALASSPRNDGRDDGTAHGGAALRSRREVLQAGIATALATFSWSPYSSSTAAQDVVATPTPQQLAAAVVGSSIGLVLGGQGARSVGAATLVKAPDKLKPLLHDDEVFAVSVSHNFDDWNDFSKAMAVRYTQVTPDGKGSSPVRYEARLIHRFMEPPELSNPFPRLKPSFGTVDVAILAVRIPLNERAVVDQALVPMADTEPSALTRARFIAVGYGDHTPEGLRGEGKPVDLSSTYPPVSWREGSIISVVPSDRLTQYGQCQGLRVQTNAPTVHGDSGGGLFLWNPARQRVELTAICSTGNRVGKNVADFDELVPELSRLIGLEPGIDASSLPPDAIIYRSQAEFQALEQKFRRQAGGWILDSEFRAGFEHISSVNELIDRTVARYNALLAEREKIRASVDRLNKDLETKASSADHSNQLRNDIELLRNRALGPLERELESLKPTR
jgi:hypothetical protein